MSISGLKDLDREVLKYVDDKELLKICSIDRKTWNEVCTQQFLKDRLIRKYPGIEEFKEENETWKQFFLKFVYYTSLMNDEYEFQYRSGNFKKQYNLLKKNEKESNMDILLVNSAETGEFDLVKYALQKGADVNAYHSMALGQASTSGHLDIVKYFVEHGADIHMLNDYALRGAIAYKQHHIVEYLKSLNK